LIDGERILEEETIDDVFGLSTVKGKLKNVLDEVNVWLAKEK